MPCERLSDRRQPFVVGEGDQGWRDCLCRPAVGRQGVGEEPEAELGAADDAPSHQQHDGARRCDQRAGHHPGVQPHRRKAARLRADRLRRPQRLDAHERRRRAQARQLPQQLPHDRRGEGHWQGARRARQAQERQAHQGAALGHRCRGRERQEALHRHDASHQVGQRCQQGQAQEEDQGQELFVNIGRSPLLSLALQEEFDYSKKWCNMKQKTKRTYLVYKAKKKTQHNTLETNVKRIY